MDYAREEKVKLELYEEFFEDPENKKLYKTDLRLFIHDRMRYYEDHKTRYILKSERKKER